MVWLLLLAASIVEIVMAVALKLSHGWTRLWPSVIGVLAAMLSVYLLTQAIRYLPVGTAYAIWTGIGAVGITLFGIFYLGECAAISRLLCIGLIVAGIVGLKLIEA